MEPAPKWMSIVQGKTIWLMSDHDLYFSRCSFV
jgi:hypothetical protein